MNDFYTIKQVAERLELSQKTIRKYIANGQLKATKKAGAYKIDKDDFTTFEENAPTTFENISTTKLSKTIKAKNKKYSPKDDIVNWTNIEQYWQKPIKTNLTSVDLFCGAGGIAKGFELAGINNICGLDVFKEACATYDHHFEHPIICGNIQEQSIKEQLYQTVKEGLKGQKLNIVSGGFPCQGFSMAGHRIVADERNALYVDMLEIVNHLQPDFVVMENVVGLRSMLEGKIEQKIIEDYQKIGYNINVTTLRAADYYVPQKRDRVIFIGNRIGKENYHPKPILSPSHYITLGQAIEDLQDLPDDKDFNHLRTRHSEDMKRRLSAVEEGKSLYKNYSDAFKKSPWNEPSCTIKENHGGVNIHPKKARVLTVRELARLQSFPDNFIFKGTKSKQLVQIGNAVPPLMAKAIGLAIVEAYKGK